MTTGQIKEKVWRPGPQKLFVYLTELKLDEIKNVQGFLSCHVFKYSLIVC